MANSLRFKNQHKRSPYKVKNHYRGTELEGFFYFIYFPDRSYVGNLVARAIRASDVVDVQVC
jgi:hypothetical protein